MSVVYAILAFGFLIAFHEFGHMWVARKMGMRVERFSIGFGPTVFSWQRGGTEYVLSAFPLGGYVKIAGMAVEDEVAPDDTESYANKPAWRRLLVIGAGPGANYLLAFLIGIPLVMFANSRPDYSTARIGEILDGGAAQAAGLQAGDRITQIGSSPVTDWYSMSEALDKAVKATPDAPVPFAIERGGNVQTVRVTPKAGKLGIASSVKVEPGLPFTQAVPQALENIWLQTAGTVEMLWKMITGKSKAALSGPVGILSHTAEQAKKGLSEYVQTIWLLSIAIGFFNLLPIPALDGGRIGFLLYEVVSRRRMNQRVEGIIHTVGLVALLGLIVFVSFGDIGNIMRKFKGG